MSAFLALLALTLFALTLFAVSAMASAAALAAPTPVSPGDRIEGSVSEARCPTFSWAGSPMARGYEVAVFQIEAESSEARLVMAVSLPADTRSWTPAVAQCLERGGRYAWSIGASSPDREVAWSAPFLFEIEAAPSPASQREEIEELERPRAGSRADRDTVAASVAAAARHSGAAERATAPRPVFGGRTETRGARSRSSGVDGLTRSLAASTTPGLGNPSLRVGDNVALGPNSNVFKDGDVFLWDDTDGNTAVGRRALGGADAQTADNTAVGWEALPNANSSDGSFADAGSRNTALGSLALRSNTTGFLNSAVGFEALLNVEIGMANTALGSRALQSNATGNYNTAVGVGAGFFAQGSNNVFINSYGDSSDNRTLRIGRSTGNTLPFQLQRAFIHGIRGVTTGSSDRVDVVIDANGQLGTVVSTRSAKQEIQDAGPLSERLLALRPVAFRYRADVSNDPNAPLEFGLIAEEVAEHFPELVSRDAEHRPESVKYHLLSSLLLSELQKQQTELASLRARLVVLEERDAAVTTSRRARRDR